MTVYTLAGGITSALVGVALAALGRLFLPAQVSGLQTPVAIAVAVILMARELGWISFPLPQFVRQTQPNWARVFPNTLAATLWGIDLGLIFSTWLTFSGVWLLVVVATLARDPALAAALLSLYWCGRALPVWVAPMLVHNANAIPWLLDSITAQRRLFQRIHAGGLVWSVVVLAVCIAFGSSI